MKRYNLRLKYGTFFNEGGDGGAGGDGDGDGDGGGGGSGDWRDGLGELKDDKSLADFKDVGGLAKAYLDTKADVGRSIRLPGPDASAETIQAFNASLVEKVPTLVNIPGEDSSEEAVASFYTQLGKPSEASKYVLPENMPDGVKANMTELANTAFKLNLTQEQFKELSTGLLGDYEAANNEQTTNYADEHDKLKLDWGSAIQTKSQAILELAKQTGAPDSLVDAITNRKMDMGTMKWLDGLVTSLSGEGGQMNFQGDSAGDARVTPSEAKNQIDEIMARKEYWDSGSPLQQGLVDKVVALGKLATAA